MEFNKLIKFIEFLFMMITVKNLLIDYFLFDLVDFIAELLNTN